MSESVHIGARGRVAILAIDNPPVNAPTPAVRRALFDAIVAADSDPDIAAIVLRGNGRCFGAGAELVGAGQAPSLSALAARIEACGKPVVAALHGLMMNNGSDLALAAHYRVGARNLRLGFGEIKLGIIPSGGATQRLPRLVGASAALDMFLTGQPVPAGRARAIGLIDRVERGDVAEAAVQLAQTLVQSGEGPRRTCDRDNGLENPSAFGRSVASHRAAVAGEAIEAQRELIACVEGALLLPFKEGLAFEEAAFELLASDDTAQALRHIFFAERGARRFPDLAQITPREVDRVAILGGGHTAVGLAMSCLNAGLEVVLTDSDEAELEESYVALGEAYDRAVALGEMPEVVADERLSRLTLVCGLATLSHCDLIVDTTASAEDAAAYAVNLDAVLKAGAIIATMAHGGIVAVSDAVSSARRPDIVGLARHGAGALEFATAPQTARTVAATVVAFSARLGAIAVQSQSEAGGAGARLFHALHLASDALVVRGASPEDVDRALVEWGLSEGPFAWRDRIGLTIAPDTPLTRAVLSAGGSRILAPGSVTETDPAAIAEIVRLRAAGPDRPRTVSAETIKQSTLAALANAGAVLLSEDAVRSPADIDVLAIHALGLSRRVGGPMKAADLMGLLTVRRSLDRLNSLFPGAFAPAPMFDDLIKNGTRFDTMNAA